MDSTVVVALVAAAASLAVALVTYLLGRRSELDRERQAAARALNAQYLNPLRLVVVEITFRLDELAGRVQADGDISSLKVLEEASEIRSKDPGWFVGEGCYLASTAYLTGCLFAQMFRLRDAYSYIRLPAGTSDTDLVGLVLRTNLAFLADNGIYYALQYSIGKDMVTEDRLRSYREFCDGLVSDETLPWFEPLIRWYLELGSGRRLDRATQGVEALKELSRFLDRAVGGSPSLTARFAAESRLQSRR
jgi:hypothetical protein